MVGQHVDLQLIFALELDLTELTNRALHPVYPRDVCFQIALLCRLVVAEIAWELLPLVDGAHVPGKGSVGGGLILAVLTLVAELLVGLCQVVPQ